jgi:hypothetical protein
MSNTCKDKGRFPYCDRCGKCRITSIKIKKCTWADAFPVTAAQTFSFPRVCCDCVQQRSCGFKEATAA